MEPVPHTIELRLGYFGYRGEDIDAILPDFIRDRETIIGLRSYPIPDHFVLIITIEATLTSVEKVFIEELAKDMYEWTKAKLCGLLRKKRDPDGPTLIRFRDVEIEYNWGAKSAYEPSENSDLLIGFWERLPALLEKIDPLFAKEWEIVLTDNNGWSVHAIEKK